MSKMTWWISEIPCLSSPICGLEPVLNCRLSLSLSAVVRVCFRDGLLRHFFGRQGLKKSKQFITGSGGGGRYNSNDNYNLVH
jgi:hypothetical protein